MSSRLTCIVAVVFSILAASGALLLIPKFIEITHAFHSEYSSLTSLVINFKYAFVAGFGFLAVALVTKEALLQDKLKLAIKINLISIICIGAIVSIALIGLLTPIVRLMESID